MSISLARWLQELSSALNTELRKDVFMSKCSDHSLTLETQLKSRRPLQDTQKKMLSNEHVFRAITKDTAVNFDESWYSNPISL